MSIVLRSLAAVTGSLALVGLTMVPAHADNPVLPNGSATGKYVDLTDKLCAKTSNSAYYAEVVILSGGSVKFRKIDRANDGSFACTGNLSIPEDKQYTLSVLNCSKASLACTGKSTTFFS